MKLQSDSIIVNRETRATSYGSSGNNIFDAAAIDMLYRTERFISVSDILEHLPETGAEGDYSIRRPLGNVLVLGPGGLPIEKQLIVSSVQYADIFRGDFPKHTHSEGEWYCIPEDTNTGIVFLDGDENPLTPGNFYYIPPNAEHIVKPHKEMMSVLVYKFSPTVVESFAPDHSLRLIGLDKE